ncbi:MAG: hypothetical protein ACRDT8_03085 [Micromonosporaceae bacterium]
MDAAILTALAAGGGTILGAGVQMLQSWRQRSWQVRDEVVQRRRQAEQRLIDERRDTYVEFMAAASAYGNRMHEAWAAEHGTQSPEAVEEARQLRHEAHQALVTPLWKLRIISSEPVRRAGEAVMESLWHQAEVYRSVETDPQPHLNRDSWTPARDRFLAVARSEYQTSLGGEPSDQASTSEPAPAPVG